LAARTVGWGVGKETLTIFSNGNMSSCHTSESGTNGISCSYDGWPQSTLGVRGFDYSPLVVFEIEE